MSFGASQQRKRWATAIVGSLAFCLFGIAFVPGLVSRQPQEAPARPVEETADIAPRQGSHARTEPVQPVGRELAPVRASSTLGASFDCMISANETIEIGSAILGVIESIEVERSDYVEAGQVLATLESSVEQAAVRVAHARANRTVEIESNQVSFQLGKKRHSRALDLYEGDTLSLDLREEIETQAELAALGVRQANEDHRLAVLQLEQAQASLARRTIRSPVSGFVVERLLAPGEVVDEETILTVAQIDPLRVEVILPTHLFGSVEAGDAVEIVPEPPLDQPRLAAVAIVDRVLDGASGTFGVRLLLPNPEHDLPGGLRCQARLMESNREHASADQASDDPISVR